MGTQGIGEKLHGQRERERETGVITGEDDTASIRLEAAILMADFPAVNRRGAESAGHTVSPGTGMGPL